MPISHRLEALSLLLAATGVLAAQTPAPNEAYQAQLKLNYKRFTRGDDPKVQDEAWGRLQWWRERMGGDLGPDFAQHLLRQAEQERSKYPSRFPSTDGPLMPAAAASIVGGSTWVNIGPVASNFTQNGIQLTKVDSGRPRVILPDTADATGNTVYLLASGGGLWKTTTFLSATPTWIPLTDFVGSSMSGSAAFGRSTSTLFVGAGDPFDAGVGGFMIKSTNGGTSWSPAVQLPGVSTIFDIKVDTSQAQDIVMVGTPSGLFRSTDGGTSYNAVGSLTGYVWSIVQTSAGWLANTVASNGTGSLMISTDHGATWSPITNAGTIYTGAGRTTLAVGVPGDSVVYAFAAAKGSAPYGEGDQQDLYRSTNGGQTWTALGINSKTATNASGNSDQTDMDLMHNQAWYNQMILVDPSDATRNTVFLGGNLSSAKTTNGGSTWTITSNWLAQFGLPYIHADFHCAAYSNLNGVSRLYVGTDGGLFTSTDGGTTWDDTKNKGLVNHLIYALAANPGTTGSALVGLQDNGTRLREGTSTIFDQTRGGDGFGVAWSQANNVASMSSYVANAIKRCTTNPPDTQSKWTTFTTGLPSAGSQSVYYFVTPIITPPGTADASGYAFYTYSRTGIIYQSNNTSWTAIGTPGSGGISASRIIRSVSHGVGVSPVDLQHVAAAGNGGNLLTTADGGTTWTEHFLGSTGTDGQNIGWYGFNSNAAWASNTLLYAASEATTAGAAHVAKSIDGGTTWTRADGGLPDVPVTKLAVDPGDATGATLYAATWIGVYRTTNGGTNWTLFGTGLPQDRATDIWVAPDSSYIRVATWGRGVWEVKTGPDVSITPSLAIVAASTGTVSITPTVVQTSSSNTVNWTASGGAVLPTNTATGVPTVFTAPASAGTYTVTATTVDTPSTTATAAITVVLPSAVSVGLTPGPTTSAAASAGIDFIANVSGISDTRADWTASGGTFNVTLGNAVTWTAPGTSGTYTVTATAHGAPTRSATTTVTVTLSKPLDLNVDGTVDVLDILELTKRYGSTAPADLTLADLNGDNQIDDADLAILLAAL